MSRSPPRFVFPRCPVSESPVECESTSKALPGLSKEDELPPLTVVFFLPIFCKNCLNFFPPDCVVELVCVLVVEDIEACCEAEAVSRSEDNDLKEARRFCWTLMVMVLLSLLPFLAVGRVRGVYVLCGSGCC